MSSDKDTLAFLRELSRNKKAKQTGWTIRRSRTTSHYCVEHNGIRVCTLSSSPSDYHALKNTRAQLRRAGFPFPR